MKRLVTDVACTRCACVCDDLQITVEHGRIVETTGACELAREWYWQQNTRQLPLALIDSQPASSSAAIAQAAQHLRNSRFPLIYGLSRSSTSGQQAAVELADWLGATIDTTASEGHAPSLLALQQTGESTCSLGEVRHRADLVIYWGADPLTTHPRHLERYSLEARGDYRPKGRANRKLVVVDHRRDGNRTAELADHSIFLPEGSDFSALWTLRLLIQGQEIEPEHVSHLPMAELRKLAEMMRNCESGVVFFGYGLARQPLGHRAVEALLKLVIDLNEKTRFYARRLRLLGDVAGADNVLCWQAGYPFAVNFSRRYPRYSPGEFSAGDVLARGEADVALFVGCDRVPDFPEPALRHLARIPTILLDSPLANPGWTPNIRFSTATYGVHCTGTAYRMDDIPVPLQAVLPTEYPTDAEVLTSILQHLRSMA